MSVDIRMNVGFGFIVPKDRHYDMMEFAKERDVICEVEDEFICLDCYSDRSDRFLGIIFRSTEDPIAIPIADCVDPDFDANAFARKYEEILNLCGVSLDEEWAQPKFLAFLTIS